MTREKMSRNIILFFGAICLVLVYLLYRTASSTYWIASLVWSVVTLGFFGIMAYVFKWLPNRSDEKEIRNGKFCEKFQIGKVLGQPINTLSNLGFVAAGLLIVLIASHSTASPQNPMTDPQSYVPLVYGLVVIFLGPGSMLFHASGKQWAGWFDTFSMFTWIGYSLSFTVSRWFYYAGLPTSLFGIPILLLMATTIIAIYGIVTALWGLSAPPAHKAKLDIGLVAIAIPGLIWVGIEIITIAAIGIGSPPGFTRRSSWFFAAVIAYGAAFVCWIPSNGETKIASVEKQWCAPESWYQGHAFWHLFSALGALFIYLYYASEAPI